jgi:tetratricopeptide (TPR) repeat protein
MSDDVKALSTELARDPQSLVFLRLGEVLRQKRQFDAAARIALHGLERHPHLADAHDLYARILADRHNYEQAFDEWDMTLRIAPQHTGALKGLAFLYFKVGDLAQAESHLQTASHIAPDDPSIAQSRRVGTRRRRDPEPRRRSSRRASRRSFPTSAYSRGSKERKRACCCSMRRGSCWAGRSRRPTAST